MLSYSFQLPYLHPVVQPASPSVTCMFADYRPVAGGGHVPSLLGLGVDGDRVRPASGPAGLQGAPAPRRPRAALPPGLAQGTRPRPASWGGSMD